MGQTSSNTSTRHDNASTRTLHSTSMNSTRPVSFFRRISNRLHVTHPTRRFGRPRQQHQQQQHHHHHQHHSNIQQPLHPSQHTSSSSTTSSVRRATQEATRAAAAVTGPPPFLLQPSMQQPNSSRNSVTSSSESTNTATLNANSYWNELLSSAVFRDTNSIHSSHESQQARSGNSFLRYLQIPLRMQEMDTLPPQPSSASTATTPSRRMHILVIEYRPNTTGQEDAPLTPPPTYRFLGLRRPRSQVSTTSSTDTIQSMPLSMNSTRTQQQQQQDNNNNNNNGQWIVYVLNNTNPSLQALSLDDNPSYEDLLRLSNMLGPARPNTTTQSAVDEAIPVMDWTDQLKDEQCLVCLDDFALKQPVRVLKCHHVFHKECVDRWLCEAHNSCPVCRRVPV